MNQTQESTRASLILRLQDAEDVTAWDEFTAIYSPVIKRVAKVRGMQAADAENLTQEVFLAVANSVSKWLAREDRGSFRPWLLRIAHNEAIDFLTARATRSLGRDGSAAQREFEGLAAREELSSHLDREYEQTVFAWAAQQVKATVETQTWEAFWLTSVEGVPVAKAAKDLSMRVGNVYLARSRVMAKMKRIVEKYQDENDE